jgi:predicted PhzF superfamily epimerase YddE/YHI9
MKTFIIDSFAERPFKGNPAGVCIIDTQLSDETMLHIAQELNLSETAFIYPLDISGTFSIRYFSPKMEIPLCGHATLALGRAVFAAYGLALVHFINIHNLDLAVRISKDQISIFGLRYTPVRGAACALGGLIEIEAVAVLEQELSRINSDFSHIIAKDLPRLSSRG